MNITATLKAWLTANCNTKADATDDDCRKAVGEAFADGKMTPEKFAELTTDPQAAAAKAFNDRLGAIEANLEKVTVALAAKTETVTETKTAEPDTKTAEGRMNKLFRGTSEPETGNITIRVKEAAEQYSSTKSTLIYPTKTKDGRGHIFAGEAVRDPENPTRTFDNPSQRDMAIAGAWGKYMISASQKKSKTLAWMGMPQHDKELILYAMENENWGGTLHDADFAEIDCRRLSGMEQKALIDDVASGGVSAVPIIFDDQIVSTPLLKNEFYPSCNQIPIERGRRIQGASVGTLTSSWGGVDDTDITLFNTASFVSAFDTTVYRWEGSIRIGRDFMSDTPVNFGQFLTKQYGEVLAKQLDYVVCLGNGTTQPEGIMTKTGTTSVAFGGTTSIGNYESLRFSVAKAEHSGALARTAVFGANETTYQRAIGIPVGASDARRLSGPVNMPNYDGYSWMQRPFKISADMANTQIFYAILGGYRMYVRRGLEVRSSIEGDTLTRKNEMLIVAMARYGGQLERGALAGKTTTAEA